MNPNKTTLINQNKHDLITLINNPDNFNNLCTHKHTQGSLQSHHGAQAPEITFTRHPSLDETVLEVLRCDFEFWALGVSYCVYVTVCWCCVRVSASCVFGSSTHSPVQHNYALKFWRRYARGCFIEWRTHTHIHTRLRL